MSAEIRGGDPQVVRANKLDLVERLADDLAHEIKNPLHSMVINLEVLKRRITRDGGSEPGELMRYAGVLGAELERVNRRVELLLRLVRPERGAELTSLPETVDELLELLELERDRRSVHISFDPAPVPVRGHIPRDAARQIVLSLLLESLDLLSSGGSLAVSTAVENGHARLHLEGTASAEPGSDGGAPGGVGHLAAARYLVEGFGGALDVEHSRLPGHFQLSVSLPLTRR